MDDAPLPAGLDWRDVGTLVRHLQSLLPPELRGVDCILQWSAKMGFRAPGLVRCKLWFALTAPVADDDLHRWARAWNAQQGAKIIDHALFHPVQLHYIADPILAAGIADPLAGVRRWHWCPAFTDRATIVPPKGAVASAAVADSEDDATLVRTVVTGDPGLHDALRSLAARHVGRGTPPASVETTLRGLLEAWPQAQRDDRWRERRAEIPAIVQSAARKFQSESSVAFRECARLLMQMRRERRSAESMRLAAFALLSMHSIVGEAAQRLLEQVADWCCRRVAAAGRGV
jgi:hypothetical protein